MFLWEKIEGRKVNIIENLSGFEIMELRRDLEPLAKISQ